MKTILKTLALTLIALIGVNTNTMTATAGAQDNQPLSEVGDLRRITPPVKPVFIQFNDQQLGLPVTALEDLKNMAARLRGTRDRVMIYAVADDTISDGQEALKLSFTRAMLVRNMLMDYGVLINQVDLETKPYLDDDMPKPAGANSGQGHWVYISEVKKPE